MNSVLTIVQETLDAIGVPYPSSILSTTDPTQRQLRALVYQGSRFLRSQRSWPQLKKQASITLSLSRYQYPLPSDYYAALPGTHWHDDNQWRLIGPLSDASWTDRTKGTAGSTRTSYRIFGPDLNPASSAGQIKVNPTPAAGDVGLVLSYEYITKNMFVDSTYTTFAETLSAAGDYSLFDEDLLSAELHWRYLRAKKKDYQQEYADAQRLLNAAAARWEGSRIGSMLQEEFDVRYSVPDGGWTF